MATLEQVYDDLAARATAQSSRHATMQHVVDLLWSELRDHGVSWLGFYLDQPDLPDDRRMILGPHRNKPACSPIGLHGVCGQALTTGRPQIVDDVLELGSDYVACDPRDRAELVLPLFEPDGRCWGVFDLDSFEVGRFGPVDRDGCRLVLQRAGLATTR